MEDRSPNIDVVRSVWRRIKKAKIRDPGIRDLEPVKDAKGGGGIPGPGDTPTGSGERPTQKRSGQ